MHDLPSEMSLESCSGMLRHIAIEKTAARTNTLNHMVEKCRNTSRIWLLMIEYVFPPAKVVMIESVLPPVGDYCLVCSSSGISIYIH